VLTERKILGTASTWNSRLSKVSLRFSGKGEYYAGPVSELGVTKAQKERRVGFTPNRLSCDWTTGKSPACAGRTSG